MKKTEAKWRPYPSERPEEDGFYFATIKDQENYVRICRYSTKHKFINPNVIAWAKLPKPYDKRRTRNAEIDWHPYPVEKPDMNKCYLATKMVGKKRIVSIAVPLPLEDKFFTEEDFPVIAWAEMPEPYKEYYYETK